MSQISIPVNQPSPVQRILKAAKELEAEFPTQSVSMAMLSSALVQVELTINKADEALLQLTENLEKVKTQKTGLQAQKAMLVELKTRTAEAETLLKPSNETA